MKENAPKKIYLVPFGKPIRQPLPQEGSDADTIWSSRPYVNSNAGNIEYTRTDAFIEAVADWISDNLQTVSEVETPSAHHVESIPELGIITQTEFIEKFKKEIMFLLD